MEITSTEIKNVHHAQVTYFEANGHKVYITQDEQEEKYYLEIDGKRFNRMNEDQVHQIMKKEGVIHG